MRLLAAAEPADAGAVVAAHGRAAAARHGAGRCPCRKPAGGSNTTWGPTRRWKFTTCPHAHWHRRGLLDTNRRAVGQLSDSRPPTSYSTSLGDTAYADHFEQIERQFGPLDIVLMPIRAYKPAFMMQPQPREPPRGGQGGQRAARRPRGAHAPRHLRPDRDEPASEPLRLLTEVAAGGMLRGELHAPRRGRGDALARRGNEAF
ncbi:MAG: hypothetical protein WKG07_33855 [Hymenobacter sp.]